jgi:HEAT repeat protein
VAIKASSAQQIEALVTDLIAGGVQREVAVARLTVLGARAVERLIAIADSDASSAARAAAFRTLEGIADPRALDAALRAIASPDATVATAAIGAGRVFIRGPRGASVVEAVTTTALDRERPEAIRLAALRALTDLERSTIAPLLATLASDPSPAIRSEAALHDGARGRRKALDPSAALSRAAEQELPDAARVLQAAIVSAGDTAALPLLLSIIDRVREREAQEPPGRRMEWTTARAAAHAALAKRGSRIALYDLRESLEAADGPLPVEFLAALSSVGDASCLGAIAGTYVRSAAPDAPQHDWWRRHLADAFKTIVRREKITRRHAAIKKIEKRWKNALEALWPGGAGKAPACQ